MHQTVIGQELIAQMDELDIVPDYMIGYIGGDSNFAGFAFPMIEKKRKGKVDTSLLAVELTKVPSLTKGEYRYDFGDSGCITPMFKMHTLGHDFTPRTLYTQADSATTFARTEGIIPAPESSHAIRGAIELALDAKKKNEEKTIVFNLSGHGLLDMVGYANFLKNCNHPMVEV